MRVPRAYQSIFKSSVSQGCGLGPLHFSILLITCLVPNIPGLVKAASQALSEGSLTNECGFDISFSVD